MQKKCVPVKEPQEDSYQACCSAGELYTLAARNGRAQAIHACSQKSVFSNSGCLSK